MEPYANVSDRKDYTRTIEVLVGKDETSYTVHEGIITHHSPFFRAALAHDFIEAHERKVHLPECSADTFEAYMEWIYTSKVVIEPTKAAACKGHVGVFCHDLMELYVFADSMQDLRLCNAIADECRECTSAFATRLSTSNPLPSTVDLLYSSLTERSPMRRLLLVSFEDCNHVFCSPEMPRGGDTRRCLATKAKQCRRKIWLQDNSKALPPTFILDLAHIGIGRDERSARDGLNICSYHQHDDEVPKCSGAEHQI